MKKGVVLLLFTALVCIFRPYTVKADVVCEREITEAYSDKDMSRKLKEVTEDVNERIILFTEEDLEEDYGASEIIRLKEYNHYVLSYDSKKETDKAYQALQEKYGASVLRDCKLKAAGEFSWGANRMQMDVDSAKAYVNADLEQKVTVAVIDTGLDAGSFRTIYPDKKISKLSYDYITDKSGDMTVDTSGHGTSVCGIVADLTPGNVEMMSLRVGKKGDDLTLERVILALIRCSENNVDIVNMSFGASVEGLFKISGDNWYEDYENSDAAKLLSKLYENGTVLVTSAGNEGKDAGNSWPAADKNVICVSNIDDNDCIYKNSNFGSVVDFAAPGTDIECLRLSASEKSPTYTATGTSLAAPHVAAAFAYLKTFYPDKSVDRLMEMAIEASVDLGEEGKDDKYGNGLIQVEEIIKKAEYNTGFAWDDRLTSKINWIDSTNAYSYYREDTNTFYLMGKASGQLGSYFDDYPEIVIADLSLADFSDVTDADKLFSSTYFPEKIILPRNINIDINLKEKYHIYDDYYMEDGESYQQIDHDFSSMTLVLAPSRHKHFSYVIIQEADENTGFPEVRSCTCMDCGISWVQVYAKEEENPEDIEDEEKEEDKKNDITTGDDEKEEKKDDITTGDDEKEEKKDDITTGDDEKEEEKKDDITTGDDEKEEKKDDITTGDDEKKPDDEKKDEITPGDDEKSQEVEKSKQDKNNLQEDVKLDEASLEDDVKEVKETKTEETKTEVISPVIESNNVTKEENTINSTSSIANQLINNKKAKKIKNEKRHIKDSKLKNYIIKKGITRLRKNTFYKCKNLVSVTIASTVDTIDRNAFNKCNKLKIIIIKSKKISKKYLLSRNTFSKRVRIIT